MLVSVIIPALRWDAHLERTVESVEAQMLPTDLHVEIAVALAEPGTVPPGTPVTVVANPGGSIPVGLNRAIAATTGAIVARVDSRCVLPRDYLVRMARGLDDPTVGAIGGAALVLDRGLLGSAYAVAFNSPLLGPSRYRFSRASGPTGSPYLGAWRRETLEALHGFDERLIRNQDNDLADRVGARGLRVRYDAGAVVGYVAGRSLPATLRHHQSFGWWRMAQLDRGGEGLAPRHVLVTGGAAASAVVGLAALSRRRWRRAALTTGALGYVAAGLVARTTATRLRAARPDIDLAGLDPLGVSLAPALAAAIDAAWAVGLVRGRWAHRVR
jgi:succinoglycan biosynthesis protein ExoA